MDISTVAVFGASGKVGRYVVPLMLERGLTVRALVHRTPVKAEGVQTLSGSVTDPECCRELVSGADVVVQLATTKEDPDTFFDVSVRGTLNVLEACRGADIKQLILMGGDAAFGIWFYEQPVPIDENHRRMAYPGYYAFTKVLEEVMVEQYNIQYGIPYCILRSSWMFERDDLLTHFSLLENLDPEEEGHGFGEVDEEIMALAEAGEERVAVQVDESGWPYHRHIVHIDDVVQAFGKVLGNPTAIGESFNIAGPAPFDYREAGEYLSKATGTPTIDIPIPGYHSFEIDINKARCMLGYRPENDIFHMIDRALQYREHAN
ncbi:MAG: NAD(P)-dependent oxidoreductase [Armatimonadota bacterium]|nr:NAD(P)-dependent oxidoreductase [Armatimonadota bacterium]